MFSEEPEITGGIAQALRKALRGSIHGLEWSLTILRHSRGRAAEEKRVGADILIHVKFDAKNLKYSKGVLVQAKRKERYENMWADDHKDMVEQCTTMLSRSPASWVWDYTKYGMRCGPAITIAGSTSRDLYDQCPWTAYRFFLELFRCPIGDDRITSAKVAALPDPTVLRFDVSGVGIEGGRVG
jgi:hypothetical protein